MIFGGLMPIFLREKGGPENFIVQKGARIFFASAPPPPVFVNGPLLTQYTECTKPGSMPIIETGSEVNCKKNMPREHILDSSISICFIFNSYCKLKSQLDPTSVPLLILLKPYHYKSKPLLPD